MASFAGNRNSIVIRPASVKSLQDNAVSHSSDFSPLSNALSFSVVSYHNIASFISMLLFVGCPSAIFFAVVSRLINPVKSGSFWPDTHIFDKIKYRLFPSIADSDPSGRISIETICMRTLAPMNHGKPSSVCWRSRKAMFDAIGADFFRVLYYNVMSHGLVPCKSMVRGCGATTPHSQLYIMAGG